MTAIVVRFIIIADLCRLLRALCFPYAGTAYQRALFNFGRNASGAEGPSLTRFDSPTGGHPNGRLTAHLTPARVSRPGSVY
jgi:hypothetical protein